MHFGEPGATVLFPEIRKPFSGELAGKPYVPRLESNPQEKEAGTGDGKPW